MPLLLSFTFAFNVHFIWANHTSNELCYSIDIIQINFKRKFGFVHLSRIYYRNFFEKILNKKEMKTFSAFSTCCIYQVNYDTVGP